MIETIYLDMDGVLCDFSKRYRELFECDPHEVHKKLWTPNWEKFVGENHFATLEWHPEGKQLYDGVVEYAAKNKMDVQVLTSAGGEHLIGEIAYQKRQWLINNDVKHRYLNVVPGKRFKKDFAESNKLIIDDTESIIIQFREAGGKAIHHIGNAKETLDKLNGGNYES